MGMEASAPIRYWNNRVGYNGLAQRIVKVGLPLWYTIGL